MSGYTRRALVRRSTEGALECKGHVMQRPLLFTGFMATGKTTVARRVAEETGRTFVDLDERIAARAGKSVTDIFSDHGEAHFRELERAELGTLLDGWQKEFSAAPVISLGGGALLEREQRVRALDAGVVVCLMAAPEEIAQRLSREEIARRPLLQTGDPAGRIRTLLEQRKLVYREAHVELDTTGRDPEDLARAALAHWRRNAVAVAAGEASYVVEIGRNLVEERLGALVGRCSSTLLVTDTNVAALHGAKARLALAQLGMPNAEVQLTPGEEHKNLRGLESIFEGAFQGELDRSSVMVGFGGGVVTDMTGFAAATWMRGVRWVGVPTTLLAMVDASVGGKTAVDFRAAKNSVGAFWQPSGVLCDVATLRTETERAFTSALAEVVKTAIIGDPALFTLLEEQAPAVLARDLDVVTEIVERSVRVKARIVSLDEREGGLRAVLNLGHTVGHALEAAGGFTSLTHGEAVSLGLVAALRIGEALGETPRELTARTLALLERLKLPRLLKQSDLAAAAGLLGHDKKRAGKHIKFVVARRVGHVGIRALALDDLTGHTLRVAG